MREEIFVLILTKASVLESRQSRIENRVESTKNKAIHIDPKPDKMVVQIGDPAPNQPKKTELAD